MTYYRSQSVENPLRESFDIYLYDKHTANDLIASLSHKDSRDLLLLLRELAPHAVAKALAVLYPWSATVADETEARLQEMLPFSG